MLLTLFFFITAHLCWVAQSSSSCRSRSPSTTKSGRIAATWYAGWHASNFTLQDLSWKKYDMVFYSFATTTPNSSVIGLQSSDEQLIPQFVDMAHKNNVTAMLSVGGWTGSRYFSTAVATEANRTAFAAAILKVVSEYKLDGIEFDWEYPGKQGIGCNTISSSDNDNFLLFLQALRQSTEDLILTAAVSLTPFVGSDGNPMTNVDEFSKVLDYIEIMNYDVWGSFSPTVGPNSPLNDSCAAAPDKDGSAVSAVNTWHEAGFPIDQMILGVGSYGHSYRVNESSAYDQAGNVELYANFDKADQPAGDKWDGTATGVDVCGNPNVVGGVFDFWGMIDAGFLSSEGIAASGISYRFDNCSKTALVYNSTSQVMVSYDDARAFTLKGQFINSMDLAGFSMWEAGGDSNDILLDAIRKGMNLD